MENVKHSSNEDASMYILRLLSRFTVSFSYFLSTEAATVVLCKKNCF